jgi:hypothetical protein
MSSVFDGHESPYDRRRSLYHGLELEEPRSIRLLQFCGDRSDETIHCNLQVVPLDHTRFVAVSYVWGDPAQVASIECNGTTISVTQSLFICLKYLRTYFGTVESIDDVAPRLWIDGLCINQNDVLEKNIQVNLMDDIYKIADVVVSWVGESDRETDLAFQFLERLGETWQRHVVGKGATNFSQQKALFEPIRREFPEPDDHTVQALLRIFRRPWFSRVWTYQEAVLARGLIFLCGHNVPMDSGILWAGISSMFMLGYRDATNSGYMSISGVLNLQKMFHVLLHHTDGSCTEWHDNDKLYKAKILEPHERRLTSFLLKIGYRATTDDRDRVYSLLGLLNTPGRPRLLADYSKTFAEVCLEATRYCILHEHDLGLLNHIQRHARHIAGTVDHEWPSWVPDLRILGRQERGVKLDLRKSPRSPRASGESHVSAFTCEKQSQIAIRGFILCRADRMIAPRDSFWRSLETCQDTDSMFHIYSHLAAHVGLNDVFTHPQDFESKFQELLVAGQFPTFITSEETFYATLEYQPTIAWVRDGRKQPLPLQVLQDFNQAAEETMLGRRIFVSRDRKHIGLIPWAAGIQDYVCILLGATTPFVLRPREELGMTMPADMDWIFLGEAYVQGNMDGEAMQQMMEDGFEYVDFVLS